MATTTDTNNGLLDQHGCSNTLRLEHIWKKHPSARCFCLIGLFFVISSLFFLKSLDLRETRFLQNLHITTAHTFTAVNMVNATEHMNSYTTSRKNKYLHEADVEGCARSYLEFIRDANATTSSGEAHTAQTGPPWELSNISDDMKRSVDLPIPEKFHSGFQNPCWFSENNQKNSLRCLPYFFLAGFPKAGTTDLFSRIRMHPQVMPSVPKESHWWTRTRFPADDKDATNHSEPFGSYLSRFSIATRCMLSIVARNQSKPVQLITGDGSPSTLWENSLWRQLPGNTDVENPMILIADHIRYYLPDARIIVITRNPVSRLWSDYSYYWKPSPNWTAPSAEEFHSRTVEAIRHITDCFKTNHIRTCAYDNYARGAPRTDFNSRFSIGLYSVYLEDWLRIFPQRHIHVLRTEDYQRDPQTELTKIYMFLGLHVPPAERWDAILKAAHKNVGPKWSAHVEMWNSTRKLLTAFFRPFNRELSTILKNDKYLWEDDT